MIEDAIKELNAALALARPAAGASAPNPQSEPARVVDERATAARSPSIAQPSEPEPARDTDATQSSGSPIEQSETELSMAGPTAASPQADSRLASFHVSIKVLNDMMLSTKRVNLFSGIALVNDRTVDVGVTAAWDTLPAVGKRSYLDSLLVYWAFAQGNNGPAFVRIVNPSGRVLAEKSWRGLRALPLSLANSCSIGFRSGEYGGR